jgi:hypothetical protein
MHDDTRAMKVDELIGSAANQGRCPQVKINLPRDGAVEGSGRLRGSEKKNLSSDHHVGERHAADNGLVYDCWLYCIVPLDRYI